MIPVLCSEGGMFARKLASMEAEMKEWKKISFPTDFAPGQ
jgi:hypothetical protein